MKKSDTPSDAMAPRQAKMQQIKDRDIPLYPNDFRPTHAVGEIKARVAALADDAQRLEGTFAVAGRIMAINRMGKSTFLRFKDRSGLLQAYAQKNTLGEAAYELLKLFDIGDIIGLCGTIFKTKKGEWTLLIEEMRLLCKAQRPLPEKFHGLKDPEKRYRRRYVDLIMNDEVRRLFVQRSRIIQAVREFFIERDFLEVETPMMQPIAGGAEAAPFVTHHNALGMDLYLRIAPELYLKRLVVGGFERVFEINRNFRNEGISTQHNPEFTMLEFYQAYATFEDFVRLTETLVQTVCRQLHGSTSISYQGQAIELGGRWERMTMLGALQAYAGIDPQQLNDPQAMLALAKARGVQVLKADRPAKVITKLFESLVEPELIQPTFITHYPVEVSPLSRRNDQDPSVTDRFELFVAGREIANGFSELNDPQDQRGRFQQQVAERDAGNPEAHLMDEDYIEALEYGLPPTAGEGIGIDRLVMLLTDAPSIREVLLFPHMRSKTGGASESE